MKYLYTALFLLISIIASAQVKKSISSGYITFNSGTTMEFKSLVIDGENVTYLGGPTLQETKVSKAGVKKIVDNTGMVIYESGKVNEAAYNSKATVDKNATGKERAGDEKLVYVSANKIMRGDKRLTDEEIESALKPAKIYGEYLKGWEDAFIGNILIGGGIGLFVGGGISNLAKANNHKGGGSPAVLIVGLASTAVGIPIKISGARKIRKVIGQYNTMPVKTVSFYENTELKIIGNSNGLGFQLKF